MEEEEEAQQKMETAEHKQTDADQAESGAAELRIDEGAMSRHR